MQNKIIIAFLAVSLCVGCGNTNASLTEENNKTQEQEVVEEADSIENNDVTEEVMDSQEPSEEIQTVQEEVHVHEYTEEIATEVSCEADGLKTLICECGDSYTEVMTATGHIYENYVPNNDATYEADGTETSKCNYCESTDSRIVEGTKLEYTDTELAEQEPLPAQSQVPQSADSTATANPVPNVQGEVCPYPLYVLFYDNQGFPYFYGKWGGSANMDADNLAKTDACMAEMNAYVDKNFPRSEDQYGMDYFNSISWQSIGRYQEMQVVVRYMGHLHGASLSKPEERGIPTEGNKIFKK